MMAKDFDRIAKSFPWLAKKSLVGGPNKIKSKPFVCKIQHSRSLRFRRLVNKHVTVVQRFLGRECGPFVARTVAPNLFRRMSVSAWPQVRRSNHG